MFTLSLLSIFMLGFLSGSHCMGMCGGFSSALALQLPPNTRRWQLLLALNVGRLGSYTLIGLGLGYLGQYGISLANTHHAQTLLLIVANVLLLLFGLYIGAWNTWLTRLETLGKPIWRRLHPYLNRLLPLRSLSSSVMVGALWGWLPCGLVYSMSLYALSTANALQGALVMAVFGLGTLPNLLAMGFLAQTLNHFLKSLWVKRLSGGLMVAWALWQLSRLAMAWL